MNPVQMLVNQTARGCQLDVVRGGVPFLTNDLISLACVNLQNKYYLAARVKWCGEHESIKRMSELLLDDIDKLAKAECWQLKDGHLGKLCLVACLELYSSRISGVKIAQYMEIKKDVYYRRYRHYLNQIYSYLEDYTNIAYSHIKSHSK